MTRVASLTMCLLRGVLGGIVDVRFSGHRHYRRPVVVVRTVAGHMGVRICGCRYRVVSVDSVVVQVKEIALFVDKAGAPTAVMIVQVVFASEDDGGHFPTVMLPLYLGQSKR